MNGRTTVSRSDPKPLASAEEIVTDSVLATSHMTQTDAEPIGFDAVQRVLEIFRICVNDVTVRADDRFLDVGGDSVMAMMILTRCEQAFGIRVPPTALFRNPTPRTLAAAIISAKQGDVRASTSCLVPLAPRGTGAPIVFVHAEDGSPWIYRELVDVLSTSRPVYGLRAPDLDWARDAMDLDGLITHHVAEIRYAQPAGPYTLAGAGIGGLFAFEIACRLAADGEDVSHLILLDSPAPPRLLDAWYARCAYVGCTALRTLLARGVIGSRSLRALGWSSHGERLGAMFGTGPLTRTELLAVVNSELPTRHDRLSTLDFDRLCTAVDGELQHLVKADREAEDGPSPSGAVPVIRRWKVRAKNVWLARRRRQKSRFPGQIVLYHSGTDRRTGRAWRRYSTSLDERPVSADIDDGADRRQTLLAPVNTVLYAEDLRGVLESAPI